MVSSTSLTFGPSLSTTGFVVITTDDDVIIEGDETFRVELNSTSTNVKINDGVVTVTIKDNDSKCMGNL